jgi:hypothetical protein
MESSSLANGSNAHWLAMFVRAQAQGLHVTHSLHCQAVTITRSHNDTSEPFSINPSAKAVRRAQNPQPQLACPNPRIHFFSGSPTKLTFSPDASDRSNSQRRDNRSRKRLRLAAATAVSNWRAK